MLRYANAVSLVGLITGCTGTLSAAPQRADASSPSSVFDAEIAAPATDARTIDARLEPVLPASDAATMREASRVVGDPRGVLATPADAFLASIGVCVHVAQGVDDPTQAAQALAWAGIRNFRDDGRPATVPSWIAMHQSAGVRADILPTSDVESTLAMARLLQQAGALLAVEGPNEPNNFPVTYMGATSSSSTTFMPVAKLQRDLYAALKSDPLLSAVPVFHSSEAGGAEPDNVGLQYLMIPPDAGTVMPAGTKYADYANVHNYVSGHSGKLVDNVAWNASDPTLNGDWDSLYVEYGTTWNRHFQGYSNEALKTLPRVTTETGWLTSGSASAIDEDAQGRVFLDLYLSAFKRGFAYTFVYMLRDDVKQGSWGLFKTDFQAKKSGTYLHNFTTVLADDARRTPDILDYTLETSAETVHDLLLQKHDGTFLLVVWDEKFSGGSDAAIVHLARAHAIRIYDPTLGTDTTTTTRGTEIALTLNDHPLILAID